MIVNLYNEQEDLEIDSSTISQGFSLILDFHQVKTEEVNLYLVSEEKICEIHEEFFNDPSPTDCMTFPLFLPDEESVLLGEIFVCPLTAIKYGSAHQIDPYREALLYMVHGLLHLIGFEDGDEESQAKMRQAESEAMELLDQAGIGIKPR